MLTIPCSAVKPGDRVVIFDDLIATGGERHYFQTFGLSYILILISILKALHVTEMISILVLHFDRLFLGLGLGLGLGPL